jgi:hypothetical protein
MPATVYQMILGYLNPKCGGVFVTGNGHIKNSHQTFVTKWDRMRPLWIVSIHVNMALK